MTRDDIIKLAKECGNCLELLDWHIKLLVQQAVEAEREACAQVCDKRSIEDSWEGCYADQCAADIRARGNL